jgi:hypothetical protein
MQAVVAIINRNNSDIVSLCEVENQSALDMLNTHLPDPHGKWCRP